MHYTGSLIACLRAKMLTSSAYFQYLAYRVPNNSAVLQLYTLQFLQETRSLLVPKCKYRGSPWHESLQHKTVYVLLPFDLEEDNFLSQVQECMLIMTVFSVGVFT